MNSLEKLIADLKDSKAFIDYDITYHEGACEDQELEPLNTNQMRFVMNAIQGAINRLEALNEELERGE